MSKIHELTATITDKKGRVIAVGKNSFTKSHPLQRHYAEKVGLGCRIFLHAEVDAIIRSRGKGDKIKIERYDAYGNPKLAKPCPICELAIKKAGIRFIEYTVG